jgi:sulfur-oxidizing protein SoxB
MPIANPRWMFPNLSFGIREEVVQKNVEAAREAGAQVVVLLSHNGFDVDRKLASRVKGIDVILTGHTHDALPEPVIVGKTLVIASGSHGKFLSRLDLDVSGGEVKGYKFKLIPIFSDVIKSDPAVAKQIAEVRAPHEEKLKTVLGKTESLLYRRGNFNGTFDDLICDALLAEREADIALSPGFRWGTTVLPGQDITVEDVYTATGMTYPNAYRMEMTGARLKEILEDVADNLFNPDPYYQQGGDMVRVGGMGYRIDVGAKMGSRISDMTLLKTGTPVDPAKKLCRRGLGLGQ